MSEQRLAFLAFGNTGKTWKYRVANSATKLGEVKWYAPWRRYCFFPSGSVLFDASCLREITMFMDSKMMERKGQVA